MVKKTYRIVGLSWVSLAQLFLSVLMFLLPVIAWFLIDTLPQKNDSVKTVAIYLTTVLTTLTSRWMFSNTIIEYDIEE